MSPGRTALVQVPRVLDLASRAELTAAILAAAEDDQTWVILLTAREGDFGVGEPPGFSQPMLDRGGDPFADPWRALRRLRKPAIAALRGRVEDASVALSLCCDIRIAARSTTFAFPGVAHGDLPAHGLTQLLPRTVGRAYAADLLLTGRELRADEALAIGLVSRVVEPAQLEAAAGVLAGRLAQAAPIAMQYAKEAVVDGSDLPLEAGCRLEFDLSLLLQTSADRAEGLDAFLNRRPPRFKGE